jgi:hypothetical protein
MSIVARKAILRQANHVYIVRVLPMTTPKISPATLCYILA